MSQPHEGQDRVDYRETDDVTEVHASVLREHAEPKADTLPIPTWLGVICAGAMAWAAGYVGMFHGGFSGNIYNEHKSSPSDFDTETAGDSGPAAEPTLLEIGAKTYASCNACHMGNGAGSAAVPPLAGSEWVDGTEFGQKRLIALLLKGAGGAFQVKGQTYNGAMPPWETLNDKQIAGVITYIRQSWGNKGTEETTPEMVKAVRKEFKTRTSAWTMADLKAIPTDSKIEGAAAPTPGAAKPAEGGKPAEPAKAGEPAKAAPATGANAPAADPAAASFDLAASIKAGSPLYMATCMACHQPTGNGLPGVFPPLAKTDYVNGDSRRLVAIVLKGIAGAMKVNGVTYATGMPQPDLSFAQLKDDKNVADVLNYVRNSFGNKNDAPITPDFVSKVRKEFADRTTPWTEADLLNFPPAK